MAHCEAGRGSGAPGILRAARWRREPSELQRAAAVVPSSAMKKLSGNRLAKIAKNHVVHATSGLEPRSRPGVYEVVNSQCGEVLARVEEKSPGTATSGLTTPCEHH